MDEIEKHIKQRLDYVYWSMTLANKALSELYIISDKQYNVEELKFLSGPPFDFYRVSLQYCFIMEYCNLLAKGRQAPKENIASFIRLNEAIIKKKGEAFRATYMLNEEILKRVHSSRFTDKVQKLRDKKFGHSEKHLVNTPYSVEGFNSEDFSEAFLNLKLFRQILNNCTGVYEVQYDISIPDRDDRTENFIKFQTEYEENYFRNFLSRGQKNKT